ncbi:MAG: MerR family DNA-binding protein [Acaryochloris sp. RU_4_1]|nr:MerR family DNA-binding protein [Acaryochloris sp. RU_4_1]NJR56323.1 MerR family DNA-binding protein [Acaryochloris sp. CRU_2_0]
MCPFPPDSYLHSATPYEELGLLKACGRTEGHFRLFAPDAVIRLVFIKRLQSLGLSLQEIGECLAVYDHGELPCDDIQAKLSQQVTAIDRQVAELMLLRRELTDILQRWSTLPEKQPGSICPNLQV